MKAMKKDGLISDEYKAGFKVAERFIFKTKAGLDEDTVKQISAYKREPEWMRDFRLRAYQIFRKKELPKWGGNLGEIDFDQIHYYVKPTERPEESWDNLPPEIKLTFDRLGIPEAERKYLGGVGAQYESEVVYHNLDAYLTKKGVIFTDTDTALKKYPDLFREYFSTIVPLVP